MKKKEPMFRDFNDFVDWASGKFLTCFIEEGGKGIRAAVIHIINAYHNWQEEEKRGVYSGS